MVRCGACKSTFVDEDGQEREANEISHCCVECKKPVHSWVQEGCTVWMPEFGYYFCNQLCLQRNNTEVVDAARWEAENLQFGPGQDGWEDWLLDHPHKYFALRTRPDAEATDYNNVMELDVPDTSSEEGDVQPKPNDAVPQPEPPPPPQPTPATQPSMPPPQPLNSFLSPGVRLQECFQATDTESGQAWFGGVVGDIEPDGKIPIGFDDGDLSVATKEELSWLYTEGKLSRISDTVTGGLVHDQCTAQKAISLCTIKCGDEHIPVGVLLQDCAHKPTLAEHSVYHSHVLCIAAVDAALSTSTRRPPTRGEKALDDPRHRAGYRTFRRGDRLVYVGGSDENSTETCFGVMVVQYRRSQQLRFVITFDADLKLFSVAPWTAWRRVPNGSPPPRS